MALTAHGKVSHDDGVKTPFQGFRSKRKFNPGVVIKVYNLMKPSQILFFSALIASFLSWHNPGQVSAGGAAGNPNPLSTPNSDPPVVPSPSTSVAPGPDTQVTSNTQANNFPLSMPVAVNRIVSLNFLAEVRNRSRSCQR